MDRCWMEVITVTIISDTVGVTMTFALGHLVFLQDHQTVRQIIRTVMPIRVGGTQTTTRSGKKNPRRVFLIGRLIFRVSSST